MFYETFYHKILYFLNLCIADLIDVQPHTADWNLLSQVMFLFLCSDKNTHVATDNSLTKSFRPLRDKVWIVNAAPLAPAGAAPLRTSVLGEKSASAKAKQCSELLFC